MPSLNPSAFLGRANSLNHVMQQAKELVQQFRQNPSATLNRLTQSAYQQLPSLSPAHNQAAYKLSAGNPIGSLVIHIAAKPFQLNVSHRLTVSKPSNPGASAATSEKLTFRQQNLAYLEDNKNQLVAERSHSTIGQFLQKQDIKTIEQSIQTEKSVIKAYEGQPEQAIQDLNGQINQARQAIQAQDAIIADPQKPVLEKIGASVIKANLNAQITSKTNIKNSIDDKKEELRQ
jgi:hypothetical protein